LCSDHYVSVYYSYVYILQIHFLKFNTCVFPENFICFLSLCRNRILQQYHMSSISAQLKSHLRRSCEEELPRDQKYVLRVPIFFLYFFRRFFLTIVVVQVVQVPWLPAVTEGHVTPKGVPLQGCYGGAISALVGPFHRK
jgi:uncharacterized membrane protein